MTSQKKNTVQVRFTGLYVDRREISVADFKTAGVEVTEDYVWQPSNDFTVSASVEAGEFLATLPDFELAGE